MNTYIVVMTFVLGLSACKKKDSDSAEFVDQRPITRDVLLSDVATKECLNLEKYISAIQTLYPPPVFRYTTTNLNLVSTTPYSHNFALRLAYGNFAVEDISRDQIRDFAPIEQNGCAKISFKTAGGDLEEYTIKEARENYVSFESSSGTKYGYEWTSPQSFKVSIQFQSGDYLCNADSKVTVTLEKNYSWNQDFVNADALPDKFIEPSFLNLVHEALTPQGSASESADPQIASLSVSGLKTLRARPLRDGIDLCE